MPKYLVAFQVYATTWVEVEADSEEEAKEKAEQEINEPTLCHQCADEVEIDGVGDVVGIQEASK